MCWIKQLKGLPAKHSYHFSPCIAAGYRAARGVECLEVQILKWQNRSLTLGGRWDKDLPPHATTTGQLGFIPLQEKRSRLSARWKQVIARIINNQWHCVCIFSFIWLYLCKAKSSSSNYAAWEDISLTKSIKICVIRPLWIIWAGKPPHDTFTGFKFEEMEVFVNKNSVLSGLLASTEEVTLHRTVHLTI